MHAMSRGSRIQLVIGLSLMLVGFLLAFVVGPVTAHLCHAQCPRRRRYHRAECRAGSRRADHLDEHVVGFGVSLVGFFYSYCVVAAWFIGPHETEGASVSKQHKTH